MKWYHLYLLHPGLDRTEAMICQHLYWPGIIKIAQKEVTKCDVCQRINSSTNKYIELPAKLEEEIPWNKLCVDITVPYKLRRKGRDPQILKSVTMIGPITGWFEITLYNNNKSMTVANLE